MKTTYRQAETKGINPVTQKIGKDIGATWRCHEWSIGGMRCAVTYLLVVIGDALVDALQRLAVAAPVDACAHVHTHAQIKSHIPK